MEIYQEEEGSTFSSDGVDYDLNKILRAVAKEPVQYINVDLIKWVLAHNSPKGKRVSNADLSAPILVTRYLGQELVVDGLHRLAKAVKDNVKQLPYRRVSAKVMRDAIIKKPSTRW